MVCFEINEEANIAIQDVNETTRYKAKAYVPKKQRININSQDKTHAITAKQKEKKSNLMNTAQTTQSTNRLEQKKEQRVNNITSTRMGKTRVAGCREQERVITDQLSYGCGSKNIKYKNVARKITYL